MCTGLVIGILVGIAGTYAINAILDSQYADECWALQLYARGHNFENWCVDYMKNNPGTYGHEVLDSYAEWKIQVRENFLTEPVTP